MAFPTEYISASLLYGLQILPESLISGIILLAILLGNQTLVYLAGAAVGNQLLTSTIGRLLMRLAPGMAKPYSSMDMCNGGMGNRSWARLLRAAPDALWHPWAPSIYMSTVGFFAGWGYALQQLYQDEVNAGVIQRSTLVTTGIIMALLMVLAVVFRIFAGCESLIGASLGLVFGLAIGYMVAIALGYSTNRRATNIWGIPLLRDRINSGAPVYICPS